MQKKITSNATRFILIAVLIDAIGLGIIIPVLPELLTDLTGQPINEAALHGGWLTFTYAIMQFIFMPIIGALSDAYGRRKVLLLSLFCLGIDYLVMAAAPTIAILYIGRLISGATASTYSTANAYIADVTEPEKRAQKFGMIGAAFGIGFVLGPAIGGILGHFGPRVPFFAAAGISLANAAFGYFKLPESLDHEHRRPFLWARANPIGVFKKLSHFPQLAAFLVVMFLFSFAHFVYPSTFSFFTAEKFKFTSAQIGIALAVFGIAMAIVQGGIIRIAIPKLGLINSAVIGILMNIIGYLGIGLAPHVWVMYLFFMPAALSGLANPAIMNLMSTQVDKKSQGELQGTVGSLSGIAMLVSPVLMTHIFHRFAQENGQIYLPGAPFLLAAFCVALGLIIFLWAVQKNET